jgi:hypothetical protein
MISSKIEIGNNINSNKKELFENEDTRKINLRQVILYNEYLGLKERKLMSRLPTLLPKLYEKENYLYKKYYDDEQYLNNLNNNYYPIMRWNNNAF